MVSEARRDADWLKGREWPYPSWVTAGELADAKGPEWVKMIVATKTIEAAPVDVLDGLMDIAAEFDDAYAKHRSGSHDQRKHGIWAESHPSYASFEARVRNAPKFEGLDVFEDLEDRSWEEVLELYDPDALDGLEEQLAEKMTEIAEKAAAALASPDVLARSIINPVWLNDVFGGFPWMSGYIRRGIVDIAKEDGVTQIELAADEDLAYDYALKWVSSYDENVSRVTDLLVERRDDESSRRRAAEEAMSQPIYQAVEEATADAVDRAKASIQDVFTYEGRTADGETYLSRVDDVSFDGTSVTVIGDLYNEYGDAIGRYERVIQYSQGNVYNALFKVYDDSRGIADDFNTAMMASYLASGFESMTTWAVDITGGAADKPPGSYVWASRLYDFDVEGEGRMVAWNVRNAAEYYTQTGEFKDLPRPIREQVLGVIDRMLAFENDQSNELPSAHEISQLGRIPGAKWWPGLAIMAHGGASYHYRDGSEGPDWHGRIRFESPRYVSPEEVSSEAFNVWLKDSLEEGGGQFIMVDGQPVPIDPVFLKAVVDRVLAGLVAKHYPDKHDQRSHGRWAHGSPEHQALMEAAAAIQAFDLDELKVMIDQLHALRNNQRSLSGVSASDHPIAAAVRRLGGHVEAGRMVERLRAERNEDVTRAFDAWKAAFDMAEVEFRLSMDGRVEDTRRAVTAWRDGFISDGDFLNMTVVKQLRMAVLTGAVSHDAARTELRRMWTELGNVLSDTDDMPQILDDLDARVFPEVLRAAMSNVRRSDQRDAVELTSELAPRALINWKNGQTNYTEDQIVRHVTDALHRMSESTQLQFRTYAEAAGAVDTNSLLGPSVTNRLLTNNVAAYLMEVADSRNALIEAANLLGPDEATSAEPPMTADELAQAIRDKVSPALALNVTLPDGREITTEIDVTVPHYGHDINLSGRVFLGGVRQGYFKYDFNVASKKAYRNYATFNEDAAGRGIMMGLMAQEEALMMAAGFEQAYWLAADLHGGNPNIPPGSYVWASRGADWNGEPRQVRSAVRNFVRRSDFNRLPELIRRELLSIDDRMENLSYDHPEYPTPREISQAGRIPMMGEWWPGKLIMAHSGRDPGSSAPSWNAIRRYDDPEGLRVSPQQVRAEYLREAIRLGLAAPELDFIYINGRAVPLDVPPAADLDDPVTSALRTAVESANAAVAQGGAVPGAEAAQSVYGTVRGYELESAARAATARRRSAGQRAAETRRLRRELDWQEGSPDALRVAEQAREVVSRLAAQEQVPNAAIRDTLANVVRVAGGSWDMRATEDALRSAVEVGIDEVARVVRSEVDSLVRDGYLPPSVLTPITIPQSPSPGDTPNRPGDSRIQDVEEAYAAAVRSEAARRAAETRRRRQREREQAGMSAAQRAMSAARDAMNAEARRLLGGS